MYVPVNERGIRIGQYHHKATIPDDTVDQIRDLHEIRGLSYGQLSIKFRMSYHTIKKLCRYERRAQIPDRWKRVQS